MPDQIAFAELSADAFPFTVQALNQHDEIVWHSVVAEPGGLRIPGLAALHGPVTIRLTFPDGRVQEARP